MASCPKCGRHLSPFDIKAECPSCGVNIPNYNWEERLDEDAANAAAAWAAFRIRTGNFKSALFGKKVRILRFICTFLPLAALVLPLVSCAVSLPFNDTAEMSISFLSFVLNSLTSLNWGSLVSLAASPLLGTGYALLFAAIAFFFLAVVFGVLNFFFVIINAFFFKANANVVLTALSAVCFVVSLVLTGVSFSSLGGTSVNALTGTLSYGFFVGAVPFVLNFVLNVITAHGMKKERAVTA